MRLAQHAIVGRQSARYNCPVARRVYHRLKSASIAVNAAVERNGEQTRCGPPIYGWLSADRCISVRRELLLSFEPILLAPEEEPVEVYPYRRVWATTWLEVIVLFLVTALIYVGTYFIGLLPVTLRDPNGRLALALLPLGAWLLFSYRGERRALQPREHLLSVLILGALAANAIAVPLTERVFVPDRWLPEQGFFGRVLGYAFTAGFAAEFLKYAVLRYTVWTGHFRQRRDAIAYALAVSLGFASVLNVQYALDSNATVVATGLWIASNTFAHLATGTVVGFFLGELRTARPAVIWMPAGLLMAAVLSGVHYGFRGIAIVSGLGVGATASRPIGGLLLSFAFVAAILVIFAFLIQSADERQEAVAGRRELL